MRRTKMSLLNNRPLWAIASALALSVSATALYAQDAENPDLVGGGELPYVEPEPVASAGRGAPLADTTALLVGARGDQIAAQKGAVPEGIEPLEIDLFTSQDFYADRDLWTDPRYFRCNSGVAVESQWGAYGTEIIGDNG